MIKLNFSNIIQYPFDRKNWVKVSLILSLLFVGPALLQMIGLVGMYIGILMDLPSGVSLLLFFGILVVSMLISIPIYLLISGYYLSNYRAVMNNDDSVAPMTNIGKLFNDGFKMFVAGLVYYLPIVLIYLGSMVLGVFAFIALFSGLESSSQGFLVFMSVAGIIIAFLLFTLGFVAILAYIFLAYPIMSYIYLKTGSIKETIKWKNIYSIGKEHLGSIALSSVVIYAVTFGISMIISFIPFVSFLLLPFVQVYVTFLSTKVYGELFLELDKDPGIKLHVAK